MARVLMVVMLLAVPATAEPRFVLRMATAAPDGTAWAREMKAMAREVETATHGSVSIRWFWSGIAGDDLEASERIARGQLDGVASGGVLCERLAPTMRVLRVSGLLQRRDEAVFLRSRLAGAIDTEFRKSGFVSLVTPGLGPDIVFTRNPVRDLDELRRVRLWRWDLDEVGLLMSSEMGMLVVPIPLADAARAYDEGRVDGFIGIPMGALAFQWSTRARYFTQLPMSQLTGCILVTNRAFDRLGLEEQGALRAAGAKLGARAEMVGAHEDEQLLGGLFQRQGMKPVAISESFHSRFLAEARLARERLGERVVPQELLDRVLVLLADYRVAHGGRL